MYHQERFTNIYFQITSVIVKKQILNMHTPNALLSYYVLVNKLLILPSGDILIGLTSYN